ncbi:hypothetical protein C0993_001454, partial [Termitomyces sp. T159_Od127]
WQPEENFRGGCKPLLARFWKHVPIGKDDNVRPGFHIDADKKWIEKEKKRFHKGFTSRKKKQQNGESSQGEMSEQPNVTPRKTEESVFSASVGSGSKVELNKVANNTSTEAADVSLKESMVHRPAEERPLDPEEAIRVAEMERLTAVNEVNASNAKKTLFAPAGEFSGGQTVNPEPSIFNSRRYRQIELPESFYNRYKKA